VGTNEYLFDILEDGLVAKTEGAINLMSWIVISLDFFSGE
jgi:hypothetical protein